MRVARRYCRAPCHAYLAGVILPGPLVATLPAARLRPLPHWPSAALAFGRGFSSEVSRASSLLKSAPLGFGFRLRASVPAWVRLRRLGLGFRFFRLRRLFSSLIAISGFLGGSGSVSVRPWAPAWVVQASLPVAAEAAAAKPALPGSVGSTTTRPPSPPAGCASTARRERAPPSARHAP
jgi:hypothetical protein